MAWRDGISISDGKCHGIRRDDPAAFHHTKRAFKRDSLFYINIVRERVVDAATDQNRKSAHTHQIPTTTTSEQRTIESAVMASEIERLPDLEGFLKFASIPDWIQVTLSPATYPTVDRTRRSDAASTANSADAEPAVENAQSIDNN